MTSCCERRDTPPSTKMEPPTHPSTKVEDLCHRNEGGTTTDEPQPLRRPMNAFLLFCKRHRRVVKSQHPWLDNRSCTKMLADMWSVLDGDEKNKYLQLARECKAAFMKAHPGYKWCGSSKQNLKPSSPTVTTRTKLPLTPPSEGGPDDAHRTGQKKTLGNCKTHMGITLGKLADPAEMGGLSLLLLAGQQAMSKTLPPSRDTSPPGDEDNIVYPTQDSPTEDTSRLFEFAEMCSSRQIIESSRKITSNKPPTTITTPPTTPVLPDTCPKWTNQKSDISIKTEPPYTVEDATNNNLPPQHDGVEHACRKDKKGHKRNKKRGRGEKKKKKSSRRNNNESRVDLSKIKMKGESNRVSEDKYADGKLVKLSEIKLENRQTRKGDDGNTNTSASYDGEKGDKDVELPRGRNDDNREEETKLPSGRRKSSRSCKGRLYREMVMGGMLESLQRPERPFNCKKPWRHGETSTSYYSDGEDTVFEPEPEKPKRPSRRKSRKRTLSGCGLSLPADFDYGEIDVEARLATLPQYSPDQFQPRGKGRDRAKRSSSLYKNATFVSRKETNTDVIFRRSYSNPEGERLSSTQSHASLTGSQKRKARKCSIMHLTPTQNEKVNDEDGEIKCPATQPPELYSQQQLKSTRVRLEFPSSGSTSASASTNKSRCKDNSSNNKQSVKGTTDNSTSSSVSSSAHSNNSCGGVKLSSRESRSASQKACSSSQSTALKIGMHQSTLTVP